MTLLEHYLKAIRMYLPKGAQQDDIITELSEHLQSTIEEQEAALGRRLTEVEQVALLTRHGNPMLVAERYGATNRNVALGWRLIGPELFPLYARILVLNWVLTIVIPFAMGPYIHASALTLSAILGRLLLQLAIVTSIFAGVDALQRRSRLKISRVHEHLNWRFPPAYLQPVPRWQSLSGVVILGAGGLWWGAIPYVPALLLGRTAGLLELAPSWGALYWPVLLLFLAGVAQRATTFAHPDWNWLQAITRLTTNTLCVALLYPFVKHYPYVVVANGARGDAAELAALRVNGAIWWIPVAALSFYWLINAAFHLWLCVQFARYARRRRAEAVR